MAVPAAEGTESCAKKIDFEALMAGEQKRIFLLCLRLLRDRDEADSATQDVFVEASRTMQKSGKPTILEPAKWLTRVALNTCYCAKTRNRARTAFGGHLCRQQAFTESLCNGGGF